MRNLDDLQSYKDWLKAMDFNDDQVEFIAKQRENYLEMKKSRHFYYDAYERDMWYTMNQSGLFENEKKNRSKITSWDPHDTRLYITEI